MNKLDALAKALEINPVMMINQARPFVQWAKALGIKPTELFRTIVGQFDAADDGRAVPWRVRMRLYVGGMQDAEADTDPDLPPDQDGAEVITGLHSVCFWAADICRTYHSPHDLGATFEDEFVKRIGSIRPTLSRNDGVAAWRIPYKVGGADWLARIDIKREANAPNQVETRGIRALLTDLQSQGYMGIGSGADSQ